MMSQSNFVLRRKRQLILKLVLKRLSAMRRSFEKAHGDIAYDKGIVQVVHDAGLSHESLYKAFSDERSTGFDIILKIMAVLALELKLHAEASHG